MSDIHWFHDGDHPAPYLRCAHCGEPNLHQGRVRVFRREAEDAVTGLKVTVDYVHFAHEAGLDGNPSARRDGLIVEFSCEQCPEISELHIWQHKGTEYLELLRVIRAPARTGAQIHERRARDSLDPVPF